MPHWHPHVRDQLLGRRVREDEPQGVHAHRLMDELLRAVSRAGWKTVARFFATGQLRYERLMFKALPLNRIVDALEMPRTTAAVRDKILIDPEA